MTLLYFFVIHSIYLQIIIELELKTSILKYKNIIIKLNIFELENF